MESVSTQFFEFADSALPFAMSGGGSLSRVRLAYEQYGEMNADRSNVILLFHALTGSQHAAGVNRSVDGVEALWTEECHAGWWDDFVGPGKALNTDKFCVICVNCLGGCYGSTGPASTNPETGEPYGGSFPRVSFIDIVRSQAELLDHLGVDCLHACVGASVGGMMTLTFSVMFPERVKVVMPLCTGMRIQSLARIHNYEQAHAIEMDPNFSGGDYYGGTRPDKGLALARVVAHKTYVSLSMMEQRARGEIETRSDLSFYRFTHPVESYMKHQGKKFVQRFDANTYLRILDAWQTYDLLEASGCETHEEAFARCAHQRFMVFSVDSDVSFYPVEQYRLVQTLKKADVPVRYVTIHSDKGHDAFLLEPELFTPHLAYSLENAWE